jgi:hypothetical protein
MFRVALTRQDGYRCPMTNQRSLACGALVAALLVPAGAVVAYGAHAAKAPAPPRAGVWKLTVKGAQATGSFRVTKARSVSSLRFTTTQAVGCFSGVYKLFGAVPIIKAIVGTPSARRSAWIVGESTGAIGGGTIQGDLVALNASNGARYPGDISITFSSGGSAGTGDITWAGNTCLIAFTAKRG